MDNTSPFQPWASDDSAKNVKSERDVVDDAKLHRENVNHPKHRQTASYDKESVAVPSLTPGTSSAGGSGTDSTQSRESKMDSSKVASMQQIVENTLSQEGRQRVSQLLEAVEALSGAERLLLYLRLPTGIPPHDPLKQPMNPLGSRAELQQTVIWIQTHLEVDPDVSLPKQDVYDEYIAHCMSCNTKPLSTADFGKVMKQVYPTVRPRRLGTRGNSRYCYAGLRKKIKLEVPQLPDLGESSSSLSSLSKEPIAASSRETEKVVCDWAEAKLGVKFGNISELARHLMTGSVQHAIPSGPTSITPPPLPPAPGLSEEQANRQLLSRLKRKMQVSVGRQPHDSELIQGTQGSPGRPKKNKGQELAGESPPSTSYVSHHPPLKHESENLPGENIPGYGYQPTYVPMFDRPPFPPYTAPRAHPSHSPHGPHPSQAPHPPMHDYRQDPYAFESSYARDLSVSVPSDVGHNLPINLSSDASLDLSTERGEWQRRRPPEPPPPPPRLPLPGKKLILETYQSETRSVSPRSQPPEARPTVQPQPEEFPRTEYLPKKMRAAEILGGKIAAARLAAAAGADSTPRPHLPAAGTAPPSEPSIRPEVAFLEDSKNLTSRSKSTAAALAREEQEAASLRRAARAPSRRRARPPPHSPQSQPELEPDPCCGLGGINIKTGMICAEKHTEILNRERVISICNIDKHDLDDYLNEGSSQDHEEELVHYFHKAAPDALPHPSPQPPPPPPPVEEDPAVTFLETQDPQDEHSQGKNEKISQLRELLAKNLKNQSGSTSQTILESQGPKKAEEQPKTLSEGAFKPLMTVNEGDVNGTPITINNEVVNKHCNSNIPVMNGNSSVPYVNNNGGQLMSTVGTPHLYNGHCHNEPQSPTSRTQQYDFVPISDGCHSPGNFNSKSPPGFGARGQSPTKVNKQVIMGGSLQTSPISHSTAASPFVSPRNTPVPRSRFCSRPIPKLNGRKRRNPLSLGMSDPKQFAVPNDQKFTGKAPLGGPGKYCQPMSAPPSPNILCSQYKNQMYHCGTIPNGANNLCLNFLPNQPFRDHMNGDQPLSADPLSNEVSQFFQEAVVTYSRHDAFRSQSVPLKHAMNNTAMLSYNNTPVGSVPPTPIPNEFCDFGSLADTCDITKAGLNRETLDKIYNAIDSNNDVLSAGTGQNLLSANDTLTNDCDPLPDQPLLSDHQLTSLIPTGNDLLDRSNQFNQSFTADGGTATDNVEDFLKRANSMEFELNDLVDKNKYYTSRSVPSTPLPYKRPAPNLQIDSRRSRELFAADNNYSTMTNGISSKSVPSTPQFVDEKSFFGFSNRDFLINGNSVSGSSQIHETVVDNDQELTSPLHDMLREDILAEPLTPALLADLDKMDGAPYVDL